MAQSAGCTCPFDTRVVCRVWLPFTYPVFDVCIITKSHRNIARCVIYMVPMRSVLVHFTVIHFHLQFRAEDSGVCIEDCWNEMIE
jgi:hypothetical protein